MSLLGVLLTLVGGASLIADFQALFRGESLIGSFLSLGAGLFLSCFGLMFAVGRERAETMHVDAIALSLTAQDDRVAIPWSEVAEVAALPAPGEGQGWTVTLQKHDGGVLELLGTRDEDEASRIVREIQAARGDRPPAWDQTGQDDPEAYITGVSGVRVERRKDGLEVSWNATMPLRQLLIAGPVGGMALIVFGFHREQGGFGTLLATGFIGLMAGLLIAAKLRTFGVRQSLHLGPHRVRVERRRRGKVLERKSVATAAITAVDYTHRLNVIGAQLNLRTGRGAEAERQAAAAVAGLSKGEGDAKNVVQAFASLMKQGIQIPMGALSLPAKVAVDLAVSRELARLTSRASASV
ncbi:MAG: hypothetical protein AAGA56_13420 [Myxococcota bacterium]